MQDRIPDEAKRRDALNALCPYFTMFPLDYPRDVLADLPRGSRVLDPFCGRGTTLFAARSLGLASVGVDASPVATAVSRAKASQATPGAILALGRAVLEGTDPDPAPGGEFWASAFHPDTLDAVLRLRAGLRGRPGEDADALRGILLGALHGPVGRTKRAYLSNQMPRTFAPKPGYAARWWREEGLVAPCVDAMAVVAERAERFYGMPHPRAETLVIDGDARTFAAGGAPFDAVCTSPPYHGLRTYRQENWLRLWFLGGAETPDYAYASAGQIATGSAAAFTAELSRAFANAAAQSRPGASLAVRFGSIASRPCDPDAMLRAALDGTGWRVRSVVPAAYRGRGQRITRQMGERTQGAGRAAEIDLVAILEDAPCRRSH